FTREDQYLGSTFIDGISANRMVLYPQLSLPYVTPGWYVTPKIGVNYRKYSISGQQGSTPDSISVTLPIFSIDSGMTFERPSNWFGRDYTQTLEPRLYYLNIPYEDQSDIPLFDTSVADFNFAQIFSENQFAGWDRISDANQLTAAATTRLIEPNTGAEVMRAMLGQRFYFKQSRVGLNSTVDESEDNLWEKSDVLAAFSGQVLPRVYADLAWQYNVSDREIKRYSMGARYQPEPGKVLNAAYRYSIDANSPIDQIDVSGQWPISGRWHAVGRLNYSLQDDENDQGGRIIESIAGLEYNGGCWVLRGVVRRAALTEADASTSFFIQLELNDFSRIGSNPLNLLKRNIQGYSPINQAADSSVLDE
ncbi:MAG: LPS-assembly protein LptD, partial [Propionivibrio sp.]|nr:LPS-assembly protein LptD [Propionivibrio sp.]